MPGLEHTESGLNDDDEDDLDDDVFEDAEGNFFDFTEAANTTLNTILFSGLRML